MLGNYKDQKLKENFQRKTCWDIQKVSYFSAAGGFPLLLCIVVRLFFPFFPFFLGGVVLLTDMTMRRNSGQ